MKTFVKLFLTVFLILIALNPVFSQDSADTAAEPAKAAPEPAKEVPEPAKEAPKPAKEEVPSSNKDAVKASIDDYYKSKRTASYFYLGMGTYSVLYPFLPKNDFIPTGDNSISLKGNSLGSPFEYRTNKNLYTQGFSTVMFFGGLYEIYEGYSLYKESSPENVSNVKQKLDNDATAFKQEESTRLYGSPKASDDRGSEQSRIRNRRVFFTATTALGLFGVYFAQMQSPNGTAQDRVLGREKTEAYLTGFSHALIFQSLYILGVDFLITEKSNNIYMDAIRNLQFTYIPASQNRDPFTGIRESYSGISTTIRF
ncbi:MAG: hypothetical protein SFU98_17715 [Leptospiraceae bacterium]|nr:hypothetical protein [Leptospiraceae bacterium]